LDADRTDLTDFFNVFADAHKGAQLMVSTVKWIHFNYQVRFETQKYEK